MRTLFSGARERGPAAAYTSGFSSDLNLLS